MPVDTGHHTAELRASLVKLGLTDHEAGEILHNNDDHQDVLYDLLTCGESFDGVPDDALPSFIDERFGLNADSHFTATTLLASHVHRVRAAISDGRSNMDVQYIGDLVLFGHFVGDLVLESTLGTFSLTSHQRKLIQTLIFQFGVTVDKLRAANATHDGCMGVFTPPIRALIKRTMPTVPALLDHVLANVESSRAAASTARVQH